MLYFLGSAAYSLEYCHQLTSVSMGSPLGCDSLDHLLRLAPGTVGATERVVVSVSEGWESLGHPGFWT